MTVLHLDQWTESLHICTDGRWCIRECAEIYFGDLMSEIKATRSQKVNKGYDRGFAYKRSLNRAFSAVSVWFFRWTIRTGKFFVFINKVINIYCTDGFNLSMERKLNGLCNERNELSSLGRCYQLKWQKINFGKIGCQYLLPKIRHFKMLAFRNAGIHWQTLVVVKCLCLLQFLPTSLEILTT